MIIILTQCGTQACCPGVMIGMFSHDNQHRRPSIYSANDGGYKHKTWTREDNQFALNCYFRSDPTESGYRKRMIEISQEWAIFQTKSHLLTKFGQ